MDDGTMVRDADTNDTELLNENTMRFDEPQGSGGSAAKPAAPARPPRSRPDRRLGSPEPLPMEQSWPARARFARGPKRERTSAAVR